MNDHSRLSWQINPQSLRKFTVEGLKSIRDPLTIEVPGLTVLCGQNSSGKSSALQALLLLKQTSESTYDGGPLLLSGDQVRFTDMSQLLWQGKPSAADAFRIKCEFDPYFFDLVFGAGEDMLPTIRSAEGLGVAWRSSDELDLQASRMAIGVVELINDGSRTFESGALISDSTWFNHWIHVAGVRSLPARSYPVTGTGPVFPGRFSPYVASIIARWVAGKDDRLDTLRRWLKALELTDRIEASRVNASALEVRVGQALGSPRMVNIVDVGVGVSQVLPVLVALLAAAPEDLVIVEQPELHLHPSAQAALGAIFAEAIQVGGRRIIVETHSAVLLRRLQTLVALDELPADKLALHWFSRDAEGATRVDTVQLDERGAYGDWPEDFSDVEAQVDQAYIAAATAKL